MSEAKATTASPRSANGPGHGPGHGPGPMGMAIPTEKASAFWPSFMRFARRLKGESWWLLIVLVSGVVSVAMTVAGPKMLGRATDIVMEGYISRMLVSSGIPSTLSQDEVIETLRSTGQGQFADMVSGVTLDLQNPGIDYTELGRALILVLALYLGAAVLAWIQAYVLNGIVQRSMYGLRRDVEEKIHRLPLRYFDSMPRGELLSRVTNDIDNVSQTLQQTMSQLLTSVLTLVGVLAMMVSISPVLALVAIVAIPLSLVVTGLIASRSKKLFTAQWAETGELNAQIEEAFTGHALVKVFGRQKEVSARFAQTNDKLYSSSFGAQFISGIIMPALMFVGNLVYVAVAVIGGLFVANGSLTIGGVQAFIQYSRQFTQPLSQLGSMANLLQSGVASSERVFQLLDAEEQSPDPVDPVTPETDRGELRFTEVSFRYDPETPLIDGLSLEARPGHTIAIVGPTGAGKTTLVNLIMRFYEIDSGAILLDGVNTQQMSRDDLRGRTGMVLQDTWLFRGTIRDNIAYGRDGATEQEIIEAAQATYVDRFVRTLPDGYDTVLDDEASNISAGQRQLITIARAFLAKPSVLILDEATSSVDTRTEALLQKAMTALRRDRTSFVIAHRLSTIRDADLILVMEHGSIVEQGNHDELLQAQGAYWRLYNSQFSAADTEE